MPHHRISMLCGLLYHDHASIMCKHNVITWISNVTKYLRANIYGAFGETGQKIDCDLIHNPLEDLSSFSDITIIEIIPCVLFS